MEKNDTVDVSFAELAKPVSKDDDEKVLAKQEPSKATLGANPQSSKLKAKMFLKKPKEGKKEKLPEHIRKAYITINDKKPNDPISITFVGEWTGIDINLAGKHLILEYHVFVRDRAIEGK